MVVESGLQFGEVKALFACSVAFAGVLSIIPCCREFLPLNARLGLGFSFGILAPTAGLDSFGGAFFLLLHGAAIAIPIAFATESLSTAGRLIDIARGAQFAEQLLPGMSQTSILELFGKMVALFWIFWVDYELLLTALLSPVYRGELALLSQVSALEYISIFAQSFYAGLYFAAPLLILSFLMDVSGMLVSKIIPKLPVAFELLPVKLLLILFCAGLRVLTEPSCFSSLRDHSTAQLLQTAEVSAGVSLSVSSGSSTIEGRQEVSSFGAGKQLLEKSNGQ